MPSCGSCVKPITSRRDAPAARARKMPGRTQLLLLVSCLPSGLALAQPEPSFEPRVVVVQFAPGVAIGDGAAKSGLDGFDRAAARYQVNAITRVFPFLDHVEPTAKTARNLAALRRTYYVRYTADADPRRAARELASAPDVTYAEPVPVHRVHGSTAPAEPDDALFGDQTYLRHMRLPQAWDVAKAEDGAPPVVIAIVDDGSDWRHEDLVANVWTNEDEIAGNGVDDDGNGFIDDVHGANFSNGDETDNDPSGKPGTPAWHGTAVAGAASAVTDNGTGLAGAAWNGQLMHVNAACPGEILAICFGFEGILYAAANGADVINASWNGFDGLQPSRMVAQALDLATDMGSLVVATAGNDSFNNDDFPSFPASYPRVLSVGATNRDSRRLAQFSQFGKTVNVFAPGTDIITTMPGDEYTFIASGTSFAAPLVSGVAALIKTRFPDMAPDVLREQLRLASETMDADNPAYAGQLGRGYVNAEASLRAASLPAVRARRWSWRDGDGDGRIDSGDEVTIKATLINYLADARQLTVELVAEEAYPYIRLPGSGQSVGRLDSGDSTQVTFRFEVARDAPAGYFVRLYVRIRDGPFTDEADAFRFRINQGLDLVHAALSALYVSTDGDNWTDNSGWDITMVPAEEELANWYGVGIFQGAVVELRLGQNNLTGPISPELGQLSQLREVYLFHNSLTGSIPPELGQLAQLRILNLQDNSLSGSLPPALGQLSQLSELVFDGNSLTGPLPPELGQLARLRWLHLGHNSLSGPIPSQLGQLTQLRGLELGSNSLTGPIPPELGQLSRLRGLGLYENSLTGPIPPALGQLSQLRDLALQDNSLSGPIPPELGRLARLRQFRVGGNSLTGSLPRSLLQLDSLTALVFDGQDVCAPGDDEFQAWLRSIQYVSGPTCARLQFADQVADQVFPLGQPTTALVLPEVTGGVAPITYALSPALPAGLGFTPEARTISGTPSAVTAAPVQYTYTATDAAGSAASLQFSITVYSPVAFADGVADQSFPRAQPIAPLVLPEAKGGMAPITYALSPALPAGLGFAPEARTISGTPTVVTMAPVRYTYAATGAAGSADSLHFNIEVYSPVATEQESLPESFAVRGNHPNPFAQSTRLEMDLPWPVRVTVEVLDMTGRRVLAVPAVELPAGWARGLELRAAALSSGLYLYRVHAESPEGSAVQTGRFVLIR